jgi:hypothetical protein
LPPGPLTSPTTTRVCALAALANRHSAEPQIRTRRTLQEFAGKTMSLMS